MMNSEIDSRRIQIRRHGVAFTRTIARCCGANPVWYLDITQGHDWLTVPLRELLEKAEGAATPRTTAPDPVRLADALILRLAPFLEQMGAPAGTRKEFWWEREWRHGGDLSFNARDVVVVFAGSAPRNVESASQLWGRVSLPCDTAAQQWPRR